MVTTHTVPMKPLHPLGGASQGGWKSYIGVYTTEDVDAHSLIQLSPTLNVRLIDVKQSDTLVPIPMAGGTASTGLFEVGATTASTGIAVFAIGK